MQKKLNEGDDVLILVPLNHSFHGAHGTIKKINKKTIDVFIPKEWAHLWGPHYEEGKSFWEFSPQELKKFSFKEFPARDALRNGEIPFLLFDPPSPNTHCMCEGCERNVTHRIIYKSHSALAQYDVCSIHSNVDGKQGARLPIKK